MLVSKYITNVLTGFPGWLSGKELPAKAGDAGDVGSIPGLGRSARGGHGSPLQYSCLENPVDGGACHATVHGVAKSQTLLKTHIDTECVSYRYSPIL